MISTREKLVEELRAKGLSNREAEVGYLVSVGLSNEEIATQLFVTEKIVKSHLTEIYNKLQISSRAQLIVLCMKMISEAAHDESMEDLVCDLAMHVECHFSMSKPIDKQVKQFMKEFKINKGTYLRRSFDGVTEAEWTVKKMIGEFISEGKAKT